jgi:hypothetical protein
MTATQRGKRPRQEEVAIAALLAEPTVVLAAEKVGIGESTLLRWLQEPSFKARYREARRQVVEAAIGRLQTVTTKAVDALERNLGCGIPAVEVGAAKAILDQAVKGVELVDLAERIEALEQAAAATTGREKGSSR